MDLYIWKWQLVLGGVTVVNMPEGAMVLACQAQGEDPYIWALVSPDRPREDRKFTVVGTGHGIPYPEGNLLYLDTFQLLKGRFVGHAFELINLG